jgi:glycogen operon protein
VRRFWKGDGGTASEFATRLCGSSDLYEWSGRKPYASINFVTCHDGFSLQDLVSYNSKHNEANGEDNRDGADNNDSWNCGAEGHTDDPGVLALREKQKRNFIATLLLSQGVPMIFAGDELSHTKHGNNSTYCQDNDLTWLNWELDEKQETFLKFVIQMARIWSEQPVLQRRQFFQGRSIRGEGIRDVSWFTPDGKDMSDSDWTGHTHCLGMRLAGDLIGEADERGEPIIGDSILVLLNAHHEPIPFTLPAPRAEHQWERLLDTSNSGLEPAIFEAESYDLKDRSLVVFRTVAKVVNEPLVTPLQAEVLRKEAGRAGPTVP